MKKVTLIFATIILLFSCSNDDSDKIDPSLLVTSYTEPYLNFEIFEEDLRAAIGQEDDLRPFSSGFIMSYGRDINGVVEYTYIPQLCEVCDFVAIYN